MRILVDKDKRGVWVDGERVWVTRTELNVMVYLDSHREYPRTGREITKALWGPEHYTDDIARWHIARLRRKLGQDSITLRRGLGYTLAA